MPRWLLVLFSWFGFLGGLLEYEAICFTSLGGKVDLIFSGTGLDRIALAVRDGGVFNAGVAQSTVATVSGHDGNFCGFAILPLC